MYGSHPAGERWNGIKRAKKDTQNDFCQTDESPNKAVDKIFWPAKKEAEEMRK